MYFVGVLINPESVMTVFANEESETQIEQSAQNHTVYKQSGLNLSPSTSGFQAGLLSLRSHDFSRARLGIMVVFPAWILGSLSSPYNALETSLP